MRRYNLVMFFSLTARIQAGNKERFNSWGRTASRGDHGVVRQPTITKITRPVLTGVSQRKRLFQQIEAARNRPVVWLSGPPGSGKTTLVASYVEAQKIPCLWYRVDEGDADIASAF
jgi:HrpA-like RNA helicase